MSSEKIVIRNRNDLKLVILVDSTDNPEGLVFIAHGQGGFKEQIHIQAFADVFLDNNYRVIRFDATNALGESDGDMLNVTYDSYVQDLEDVIAWAKTQEWFVVPFALCGHSMGAQSTVWYAEQNPDEVSLLASMAPTINFELHEKTMDPHYKEQWQEKGYVEMPSRSKPGMVKRVGWGVNESLKNYDILKGADRLAMPVIDVVGDSDQPCPPSHQEVFIGKVSSEAKTLVIIRSADHSYRNNSTHQYGLELEEVKQALRDFIKDKAGTKNAS